MKTIPNLKDIRPKNPDTREQSREDLRRYQSGSPNDRSRSVDHMLDLDARYPEVDIFGPQCISAHVGPGWADIVEECLKVLSLQKCKAGQIKQKFGGLRFYWEYPDHIETALAEWRKTLPPFNSGLENPPRPFDEEIKAINAIVAPVIAAMEKESFRTCELCGVKLDKEGGPCWRTLCENCKAPLPM